MKNGLIVLSGGMDSITMLYDFQDKIKMAISFDYGSNHNMREIPFAKLHCRRLKIKHYTIHLGFMHKHFKSSLLEGADAVPDGKYNDENMKSTVVPFRNGIMLSIAAGFAESHGLNSVYIANHAGDHAIYPDCTPGFVEYMSKATEAGTYNKLKIIAPYTNITKTDIAKKGKALGIDYSETWSCYKGGNAHCGTCATCTERKMALRAAGIDDRTIYLN